MYNITLEVGDEVSIYRDYRNEVRFEGKAILIEKREIGDSFYMDKEKLYKPSTIKSSLTVKPSEIQLKMNKLYDYLWHYCESENPQVKELLKKMKSLCNQNINSYNEMYIEIEKWKDKYRDLPHFINNILKVDTKYLVRYFQQQFLKDWSPTLFRLEKWLIEFPIQRNPETGDILFNSTFRTTRWVRIVLAISPSDESRLTTYNSKNLAGFDEESEEDEEDEYADGTNNSSDNYSDILDDNNYIHSINEWPEAK